MKCAWSLICLLTLGGLLSLSGAEKSPEPARKSYPVPWLRFAEFSTMPNLGDAHLLCDGDLKNNASWTQGTEAPGTLFFRFPKPVDIDSFRFMQGQSAVTCCRLYGDLTGKGSFDVLLSEYKVKKSEPNQWITLPVNRRQVHGLKWEAVSGNANYRTAYPTLREIEILSPAPVQLPEEKLPVRPAVSSGREIPMPPLTKREIDIRLCTDMWSYGLPTSDCRNPKKMKIARKVASFRNHPGIRKVVRYLKKVDANSVRLFVETPCVYDSLPWKSALWENYGDDLLKGLAGELAEQGIKLYYFSHAWMAPFQKRGMRAPMPFCRWDYPYEQSDRVRHIDPGKYKVQYPCTLCDAHFRTTWTQYLCEALDQGASGVYLMPDEWYFKGHDLRYMNCPACTEEFRKMYGYASPPAKIEDSDHYRKWKLFEYRKLAEVFDHAAETIRSRHPEAVIVRSDCAVGNASRGRMETTTAADIIWRRRDLADYAQMYCSGGKQEIAFVKEHEAVAGKDKLSGSMQWLGISHREKPDYPVQLHGIALADVMLGARAIDHYRMSYIQDKGWTENLIRCNRMIRLLEAWGIDRTDVPDSVCLLVSRASEDWWSLRERMRVSKRNQTAAFYLHLAGTDINTQKLQISENPRDRYHVQNETRGQGAKTAMNNLLTDNGVPYRIRYMDRPDTLKNLASFRLILVPFAYAVSDESFRLLEDAVKKGVRVVLFDQLAPADETGKLRKEPLLKKLLKYPNVTYLPESPAGQDGNLRKRKQYMDLIRNALAGSGHSFRSDRNSVSYVVTEYADKKGWILFLANWERKRTTTVSLALPGQEKARYAAECFSSAENVLREGVIASRNKWNAKDLSGFQIALKPAEVKLIRILREGARP